jgi:hypothetical protein
MPRQTYGRAGVGVRRMARPWLLAGLGLFLVLIVLMMWLLPRWRTPLGPGATIAVLLVLMMIGQSLTRIERRTDKMERGWKAEDAVEAELAKLDEGCHVIHDVVIGERGNIDHIVVSPTGVYAIETKSHAGKVTFDGQQLLLSGRKLEKDFLAQSYAEAMVLKEYLEKVSGGSDYFVTPLIVFTRAFVQVKGRAKGVKVLPLKWLTGELTRGKERLPDDARAAIARSLKHLTAEARSAG